MPLLDRETSSDCFSRPGARSARAAFRNHGQRSRRRVRESCLAGLRLLGVDAPSVDERHSKSLPVHKMIFSGNACLLENLDLRRIPQGTYELMAFPVKIMSLDAAPVRAILRDIE